MSTVFTVKSVGPDPREWSSQHGGTFLSYKVDLAEPDGKVAKGVEWNKKPESQAPQVSEEVVGHLEEGKFGPKFKIDYEATKELSQGNRPSGASSAPSKGSAKPWQPESERDPERAARILRQHSQEMAIRWAALLPDRENLTLAGILQYADAFDRDVQQAGQAAVQGAGVTRPPANPQAQGGTPSTTPAPEQRSAPSEEIRDVEMALSEPPSGQFISAAGRTVIANYMLCELPPEELLRACNQLTNKADQGQQDMTLRAMKLRAEWWSGKPLPSSPPDEEPIPF